MTENISSRITMLLDNSNKIVKLLTNTKKCVRAKITRGYLDARLEMLCEYWSSYNKQYEYITTTYSESNFKSCNLDLEENYNSTEEAYLDLKTWIKDWLYEHETKSIQTDDNNTITIASSSHSRPHLPPIPLPVFSGDYNDWISYRDLYISLIHNNNSLSKIEKHHYLKSSLTGVAAELLKNFTLTEANYLDAWKKLEERYDNKRIIVNNILNRLLSQKKLAGESTKGLKELLDTTSQCLDSLKNLNICISNWDAILVYVIVGKLDSESHKLWEQSLGNSTEIPTYADLASFLENRFRILEMISSTQVKELSKKIYTPQKFTSVKTYVTEVNSTCTYCSQNHYICHCKKFTTLTVSERQHFIKTNNICFNCLIKGHSVKQCRQSTTCKKCGRRHHTLLHLTTLNKPEITTERNESVQSPSTSCHTANTKPETNNKQIILPTAQIKVKANNGSTYVLRALVDQGSQASFVTEAAVQLLNLDRTPVIGKITGISNSQEVTTKSIVTLTIHCKNPSLSRIEVNAYVLRKLTSILPSREFPQGTWPSSMQLDVADPDFHKPSPIDVLLGADVHAHIILDGIHKHNTLVALNSRLGWLLAGSVSQTVTQIHNMVVAHNKLEVDQLLRQFWEIEEHVPHKKPMSASEIQCEEHYKNTYTRNDDGRYVVRLPFKEFPSTSLGDSKTLAVNRLQQMEKRFLHKPEFKNQYTNFMDEYLSHEHMEMIPENELNTNNKNIYYLPHHAVLRPSSLSTKLRVVFDGSAVPANGKSLNDELLIGPPLLQDIRYLITRWRQHKICLVADIQKMYRQILVSKKDIDLQRIVWRESLNDPIQEYRLLTVTYGTSCAPFLAIRTLHQLAEDECGEFPREAEIVKEDFYMDDLLTGTSTEESAIFLQNRLTELLARGGFPLHKWSSNSKLVLNQISNDKRDSLSTVTIKVEDTIKALGIIWNSQTDNFELTLNLEFKSHNVTKRTVLSAITKSFDPLGWLAPSIIVLKIFMQKLWLAGLDWDEELPLELKTEWFTYLDKFSHMQIIPFPRWLSILNTTTRVELHGFSDASCAAYAAVVYIRVWNGKNVNVHLVFAKTRVAPVKQITLPRLELCGAVLLAKMLSSLKTVLKIQNNCVFAWTDSTIVLAWLRKTPGTWTTFVANRTAEILTIANSSQCRYIDTFNNPANLSLRGLNPNDLRQSKLW
ncbi:uncharacterized protein LOC128201267 [Galleria mellonella]|uniref:Uncharacterized protein LOC128201267 n=1 Tax=Galleria mellonella TaxID=7137 RepID=A0ABM3MQN5_GALME|nr:uncharacterized protein LOC128201267 [Galleria mellonella]